MKGLVALAVLVLIWGAGLMAFAQRVQRSTPAPEPPEADGIVALTGASSLRLAAAAELLEEGKARRLLISGVNPAAKRADVRDVARDVGREWDCCVDLGFRAADTRGNASEIAAWAHRRRYRSLIVVTADYHMPRSMLELRASLPGVALHPYPVATGTLEARRWWRQSTDARRMAVEYSKYLVVLARSALLSLDGAPASPSAAVSAGAPA